MRYFLDTEFMERGRNYPIDLISIALVCEDGREYYGLNRDCDLSKANDFVKQKVIPKLPKKNLNIFDSPRIRQESLLWKPFSTIREEVAEFTRCYKKVDYVRDNPLLLSGKLDKFLINNVPRLARKKVTYTCRDEGKPEFWGWYADYDWVIFAQMFGTMMDLPKGFPMYCNDLKQYCNSLGNPDLPSKPKDEHSALADARWNMKAYQFLKSL